MRKNRKRRNSRMLRGSRHGMGLFFLFVLLAVAEGICYLAVGNSRRCILKDVDALEREQLALEKDLIREKGRWAECTTPDRLERCLVRHGLHMELAGGEQIVSLRGRDAFRRPASDMGVYASTRRR